MDNLLGRDENPFSKAKEDHVKKMEKRAEAHRKKKLGEYEQERTPWVDKQAKKMYLKKQTEFLLQPSLKQLSLKNLACEPATARPMFQTEADFSDWQREKAAYQYHSQQLRRSDKVPVEPGRVHQDQGQSCALEL